MKTTIIVTLQIEGIHFWKDAAKVEPIMSYLALSHRHVFWITAEKIVTHSDRDVEFILFKRELIDYFHRNFFDKEKGLCNFEGMSCEMISQDLLEAYDLESASCLEDNENGSKVYKN